MDNAVIYLMIMVLLSALYGKGCFDRKYDLYKKTAVGLLMASMVLIFIHYWLVVGDLPDKNEWWGDLLLSAAASFFSVAITVWFVERSFAEETKKQSIHRRVVFYSLARDLLFNIDSFFGEIEVFSGLFTEPDWKKFYRKDYICGIISGFISQRENNFSIGEKKNDIYNRVDNFCKKYSDIILSMSKQLEQLTVVDDDLELWRLLIELSSKSEIVYFGERYNLFTKNDDKIGLYMQMKNAHGLDKMAENIYSAHDSIEHLYDIIRQDERFRHLPPPV